MTGLFTLEELLSFNGHFPFTVEPEEKKVSWWTFYGWSVQVDSVEYASDVTNLSPCFIQVTLFLTLLGFVASAPSESHFYLPIDCDDIYRHDNTSSSGVYTIYPGGPAAPLRVHCDMDTDGGRWTVSTTPIFFKSDFISFFFLGFFVHHCLKLAAEICVI